MPKALLDPGRCEPHRCAEGVCAARRTCAVRAIYQEAPFEAPVFDWSRCRACSRCIEACPAWAITLTSV